MENELDREALAGLLELAHQVVTWTMQGTLKTDAAGFRHLTEARRRYLKTRVRLYSEIRPLTVTDIGGCTCGSITLHTKRVVKQDCLYHYAAGLQPWNHRIPWNCPSYYDGCNCEGGPFCRMPVT